MTASDLQERVAALGPWFHNLDLNGVETAPDHFLGDFPRSKWQRIEPLFPEDLSGLSVLDVGCNAGFYGFEMKRRGAARVLGIDHDERYLEQARLASGVLGLDVEFRRMEAYDVGALGERFDLVIFMGVLYHLRHPLLALDLLREHVVGDVLVFQSLERGTAEVADAPPDAPFDETALFERPGWPALRFVEHAYAGDPTNWWIPNRAASEAMLRAAGFRIERRGHDEVMVCRLAEAPETGAAYPARGVLGGAA